MQTHAQPNPDSSSAKLARRRASVTRAADLCRRRPADFAAMVRRSDELIAQGLDALTAQEQALTESGA